MRKASGSLVRMLLFAAGLAAFASSGCGGSNPPPRGVIEANVGSWEFRRFQKVLDIEVWVPENPAVAHTASYVEAEAEVRGVLEPSDVVSAFVTRYEREDGIDEALVALARRLASESGYRIEPISAARGEALSIRGRGEAWVMWASGTFVVKVGGRGRESVPEDVVDAYARHYPSTLEAGAL